MHRKIKTSKFTLHDCITIGREAISALFQARQMRYEINGIRVELPPVVNGRFLSESNINKAVYCVQLIVFLALFWKPGRCFYRSYALACVLRKRGLPLKLNIGYKKNPGKIAGHAWLTLNTKPFAEKMDPRTRFPLKIGTEYKGIQYWFRDDET